MKLEKAELELLELEMPTSDEKIPDPLLAGMPPLKTSPYPCHLKMSEMTTLSLSPSSQGPSHLPQYSGPTRKEEGSVNKIEDSIFKISRHGASYHFPEENITVVIPPNSLSQSEKPCMASIRPDEKAAKLTPNAVSKVYEFLPSGQRTRNRMMFVIPLLPAHSYDYNNMTLMYRKDRDSAFVCVDDMKVNKPTWLFYGNVCYIFLSHFCGIYVKKKRDVSGPTSEITLQTLLLYKCNPGLLELKTTFGCYEDMSACSIQKVKQHYADYKIADEQMLTLKEGCQLTVEPKFCTDDWRPKFTEKQMRSADDFLKMCEFCSSALQWPVSFSHELLHNLKMSKNERSVAVHLVHQDLHQDPHQTHFEIDLSLDVSWLSSTESSTNNNQCKKTPQNWNNVDSKGEIKEIFYTHMSAKDMDKCAEMLHISPSDKEMDVREFSEVLLNQFIAHDHVPTDQIAMLSSFITYLKQFKCLQPIRLNLQNLKLKKNLEMKLVDLCAEKNMESFQEFLTRENVLGDEQHPRLKTYPDTFSRLMYLMRHVILPNPKHYSILKEFCKNSELQKYVPEEMHVTDEIMTYNRMQYDLPNLCEECLNCVTRKTFDVQEVINALGDADRGFCSRLNYNIITRDAAQRIEGAKDDSEALGLIRRALQNSLVPDKLDHVLRVLSVKKMGTEIHSEKIKKCYHEQIRQHKRCEKCQLQPVPDDIQPRSSEDINPGKDMEHATQLTVKRPNYPGTSQEQCQDQRLGAEFLKYHLLEELTTEQKTSRPKERLLATIAQNCVQSMLVLGIHLGFKLKQVKKFQSDSRSSVLDQVFEMLDAWRRKKKVRATVERLIVALQKSDVPELSYREAVLDSFKGFDDDTDTEDSCEDKRGNRLGRFFFRIRHPFSSSEKNQNIKK